MIIINFFKKYSIIDCCFNLLIKFNFRFKSIIIITIKKFYHFLFIVAKLVVILDKVMKFRIVQFYNYK